jgi:peroxiredoxin Q/BCP
VKRRVGAWLMLAGCAAGTPAASPPSAPAPSVAAAPSVAPAPSAPPSVTAASLPATAAAAAAARDGDATDAWVGKPAPDFTAEAHNGTTVHLAALGGKTVVIYFYPKDETPGCTREACSLRDAWADIARTGAVLVGVSADSLDSHRKFAAHHKLPFLLVSDPDGAIGKRFGVPFDGVHARQTVVIGPDGTVRKVYRHVDVTIHAKQILADLTGAGDAARAPR